MTKRIVLCADDYGQALNISEGIIDLVKLGRLSAVSCLTNFPQWQMQADWLKPYRDQIDIGLHINLTEGEPLSIEFRKKYGERLFTLPKLMVKSALHVLNKHLIINEIEAQIQQFKESMGFLPDFLDGHQHVHQFPIVRDALLSVYESLRPQKPYVRLVAKTFSIQQGFKYLVLYGMGGRALGKLLAKYKIPFNQSFAGLYDFTSDYQPNFESFLLNIQAGGIIMCHPGRPSDCLVDAIKDARSLERDYFLSDAFIQACNRHDVVLGRFK